MKLHPAMTIAERIQDELKPFCEPGKCEIAGSIRRARPQVNDLDLVILPRAGQLAALKARCKSRCRVIVDGEKNFICAMMLPGRIEFQVDIFFAHAGVADLLAPQPSNWGSLLLCRTGSKEFNIQIATRAQQMGLKWKPYQGLFGPKDEREIDSENFTGWIAGETEEQIFESLGLKWIPPALRDAGSPQFVHAPEPNARP